MRIQKMVLNHVPDFKKNNPNSDAFEKEFLSVTNMTPFYMNQRLVRQKGPFLFPTSPYCSFEENLLNMIKDTDDKYRIIKVDIEYDSNSLLYILKFLNEMNNTSEVLYGNVQGMCDIINFKTRLPNDAIVVSPNKGMTR